MTKTLAQMTGKERETCIGMWVKTPIGYGILVDHLSMHGYYEPVVIVPSRFAVFDGRWLWDQLEILPHLPRAWEPDGTPPAGEWETRVQAVGGLHTISGTERTRWVGEWKPIP